MRFDEFLFVDQDELEVKNLDNFFSFQDRIHKIRFSFKVLRLLHIIISKLSSYRNGILSLKIKIAILCNLLDSFNHFLEANAAISIGINETNNFIKIARNPGWAHVLVELFKFLSWKAATIVSIQFLKDCVHGFV